MTGAVLGGYFLASREAAFLAGLVIDRQFGGGPDFGVILLAATVPYDVLATIPIGLMASGLYRRGRYEAWHATHPPRNVARLRERARRGWILLGIGTALLAVQPAFAYGIVSADSQAAVSGLYYSHMALSMGGTILAGIGLYRGPWSAGALEAIDERRRAVVSVAPFAAGRATGLAVGGQF